MKIPKENLIRDCEEYKKKAVIKRFEVGTPVTWGSLGRTFYVVEHNQFTKVLVSNLQDVNDDNYNDWWVDIDELKVL